MDTKAETRQAILRAATGLFGRFGPIKTTVADIARELGMSPANIYNFFPSREAIIEAVGQQNIAGLRLEIVNALAQTQDSWDGVCTIFVRAANHMRDHLENEKDILQLLVIQKENNWKFVDDFHDFLRAELEKLLRAEILAHDLPLIPSEAAATMFDCMWIAISALSVLKFDRQEHERRIRAQLALLRRAFV